MKKIRFLARLIRAFIIRYKILVLFGFFLGIFFFYLFPLLSKFLPKIKSTEKIGLVGRFRLTEIPPEILDLISYGLTRLDQDGTPISGLSSSWVQEEDGRVYLFYLKENIYWHDGTNVLAKDINYNFQDAQIEIVDPKTIRFRLKDPFSPLPAILSKPVFKKGLVGIGQYKVKKINKTGEFIEQISLESQLFNLPNLIYRFYPTEESAKIALMLGEVKKIVDLVNTDEFKGWKNIKITSFVHQDRFVGIFLNTQKPLLSEKSFRQALAYALPKQYQVRVFGPLSPLSWAYNSDLKTYNYDLTNAKNLLNKVIDKNKRAEITLKLSTVPSLLNEADKIKSAWEGLGIKVEIGLFNQPDEDFDALLVAQEIPKDPDQYSLWHSTQPGNITHFKNLRIDKLLEDGRKVQEIEERRKIYFDFQRFIVEEVPVIFLYHPETFEISKK